MFLWIKRHFFLFITSEIHKLNLHKSRFICTSTFSSLSNFTFLWAFNSYSIKAIKIKSKPFQTSSFNLHSHITVDVNEVCSLMHWTPLPYFQKTFSSTSQAKKKKNYFFFFLVTTTHWALLEYTVSVDYQCLVKWYHITLCYLCAFSVKTKHDIYWSSNGA